MKGFATSISIITSSLASVVIFNFEISFLFCIGAIVVLYGNSKLIVATHLYGKPDKKPELLPSVTYEKVIAE